MNDWQREQEWLKSLKVGSEVAIYHSGSFYGRYDFTVIDRETSRYWIVGAARYRKDTGREAGDHYRSSLAEPTPELRADEAAKKRRLFIERKIDSVRWRDLPLETLEAVNTVLEAATKKPVENR